MSILLSTTPEADDLRKQAWLAKRRQFVTSTDVPVLFGQGYSGSSPTKLWREKRTGESFFEPSEHTEIGKLMEPVIAQAYENQTGRKVVRADSWSLHVSAKYPWLATSLDGVDSEGVILEMKNHDGYASTPADIPTGWLLQTQTQMLVMDVKAVRLVILCRGCELKVFDLEPHEVQAKIIERSKRFHEMVEAGQVPEPEFPGDNQGLGFAFYEPTDETVNLGDDVLELCLQRAAGLERKKEIVEELDIVEASIKYSLGNATVGLLPDESKVTWKADKNGRRSIRYYKAK
jgi:predicted phage-related endonuclease